MQFDLTKPNSGRILDYWLGGDRNFEIDRQLADQVARQFPILPHEVRQARAVLERVTRYFYARGIRHIVDFGSALPTCHNTHLVAHALDPEIKVMYSDIDPITVAYGNELLVGNPNTIYLHCDAATPQLALDAPQTRALFGAQRHVGIVFMNLVHLLNDDPVRAAWQKLYEWSAPGSCMFVTGPLETWKTEPDLLQVLESYRRSGISTMIRTREEILALLPPWQVTAEGIVDVQDWGLAESSAHDRRLVFGMMLTR